MFEHYLLILRRRRTNGSWYIAGVLCQLAAPGLEFHARDIPSDLCAAPLENEQVMLETCRGP
jgi:hypothetical protein